MAEIKGEVSNIRKDLSAVEVVTANNWSDLAKLKAIKQYIFGTDISNSTVIIF